MRFSFNILFIGFLLAGQWQISEGNRMSKPSISEGPINVNQGDDIFLECKSGYSRSAQHFLYKGDSNHPVSATQKTEDYAVVFHIANAGESDGGIYRCKYCHNSKNSPCSDLSENVQINVKGTSYSKPSISVSPSAMIALGKNATIHCRNEKHPRAEFTLKKETPPNSFEIKETKSDEIKFCIVNAKESDGGIYWCIYCVRLGTDPACSNHSVRVYIDVTGEHSTAMWAGIAGGLFLLVLLLLLLVFVSSKKRKKGSTANEGTQPVNVPLQSEPGEDLDGVSYAVLSHSSLKTKPAPDAGGIPESCTYATVAQGRTKQGQ